MKEIKIEWNYYEGGKTFFGKTKIEREENWENDFIIDGDMPEDSWIRINMKTENGASMSQPVRKEDLGKPFTALKDWHTITFNARKIWGVKLTVKMIEI